MKPAVIVPFHDPAWILNVAANLRRQTAEGVIVVLAANGSAADMELPWLTVESGPSHAHAVNAGALWCFERGYTHAVLMDSDDYYGPGYLAQSLDALKVADYCGKRSVYTWLGDGLHLFERQGGNFMGGTLGFRLDRFVPMPVTLQDDTEWCRAMERSGATGKDTGPFEYAYVRHGSNAHWQADDVHVRRAWGSSRYYPDASLASVSTGPGLFTVRPAPSDAEVFEAM